MSQQELLNRVLDVLEELGIAYFVTGSWVSSLQGEPRATHDLDLVVQFPKMKVNELLAAFPAPDYYLSAQSINEAITHDSMFNLLDNAGGEKVDFWMLTDDQWDQSRFARRRFEELFGRQVCVSTPEDTVLAKLRWCDLSGGSEKQFTDALRVYEVQARSLDTAYITQWASWLDVDDLWERLQREAEIVEE